MTVSFTDTSTGGTPTTWYSDFGDGTNSNKARTTTHTFTRQGIYTVTLTITNAAGNSSARKSSYINVTVLKPPVAAFAANITSGRAPLTVLFADTAQAVHQHPGIGIFATNPTRDMLLMLRIHLPEQEGILLA